MKYRLKFKNCRLFSILGYCAIDFDIKYGYSFCTHKLYITMLISGHILHEIEAYRAFSEIMGKNKKAVHLTTLHTLHKAIHKTSTVCSAPSNLSEHFYMLSKQFHIEKTASYQ